MELNHNDGISFTLVFKVHDDEVVSDGHKSQIVFALVYNKKPTVMKFARTLVSPGRYPVPPSWHSLTLPPHGQPIVVSRAQGTNSTSQSLSCLCLSISLPLVLLPPNSLPCLLIWVSFWARKWGGHAKEGEELESPLCLLLLYGLLRLTAPTLLCVTLA